MLSINFSGSLCLLKQGRERRQNIDLVLEVIIEKKTIDFK